MYFLRSYI